MGEELYNLLIIFIGDIICMFIDEDWRRKIKRGEKEKDVGEKDRGLAELVWKGKELIDVWGVI